MSSQASATWPSDDLLELAARRLRLLGDPTRLRLLLLLQDGEASVGQLSDQLPTTTANVSKHLAALCQRGVLARRRDGNRVLYALSDYTAPRVLKDAIASVTGYAEELSHVIGLDESEPPI